MKLLAVASHTHLSLQMDSKFMLSHKEKPLKLPQLVRIKCSLIYIEDKKEEEKAPLFVVEIYDSSSTSFKFLREVPLYKNEEQEPFVKNKNSVDFLKDSSFATNGQILMIQAPKRIYFFDMRTGIRF